MMRDDADKTRDDLLAEVCRLRSRVADLERPPADAPSLADSGQLEFPRPTVVEDQRLVCRWRPDGTLTFVSDGYCRDLGWSAEELVGRSLLSLVAEPDRDRAGQHMARLSASNPIEMLQCRMLTASGEVRWHVRADRVLRDDQGGVREVESVARDFTEQQRMKAELAQRTALLRALFESAAEGIIAVNREGDIVLANARAEAMFGYGPSELLKRPLEILVPDRMKTAHRRHRSGYFDEPRPRPMGLGMNLAGRRKDGTEFPIEVGLSAIRDEHGGVAIAFVTDISERVLRERQARHIEKLTALGSLAAGIAHEINNPIGIILSRIELMLMDAEERRGSPEEVEDLRTLYRQAQRLNRITDTLLRFGRRRAPEPQPVDLGAIVADTLLLARYELIRDGIEVATSFAPDLPQVSGDPTALQQVLMNLLLNARDAMAGGGTLSISAKRAPNEPGAVRFEVADSGHGMPADVLAKLAQPFFTTKPHGTGLGLSVSYTIIREHGGTVTVASEPGRGTTFTITLPAIADDCAEPRT
jgi:hypothetical protein